MAFPGESRRNAGRIVVCESQSGWAVATRRMLSAAAQPAIRVYETRSLDECEEVLAKGRQDLALVQWGMAEPDAQLLWAWQVSQLSTQPRVLLAGIASDTPARWAAREAGAQTVSSSRELRRLQPWIVRHFQNRPPATFSSIRDEVWSGLPWNGLTHQRDGAADDHHQ